MDPTNPLAPDESSATGCLKVVLVVVVIGILLMVLSIAVIYVGVTSEEGSDQRVRIATTERLQAKCEQVTIADEDGKNLLTLTGKDARLLGSIAQKAMAIEASTSSSFTHHSAALHIAYSSADGQAVRVARSRSHGAYYLDSSDEWYYGSRHHSFFVLLIWVTSQLEAGVDPETLLVRQTSVQAAHLYMNIPEPEPWTWLTVEEIEYVKSWVKRYDAVSGHAPLDITKLFHAW